MARAVDRLFNKRNIRTKDKRRINQKTAFLIRREGKKPDQAFAIANSLFRRREL